MGRPIKIRPVETRIVKDPETGKTIGRKPRKPSKPSKPKKPTKTWPVKKRIDIDGGESLALLMKRLPKGTPLDEVFIHRDYCGFDDYYSTYVEYDGVFEQSYAEFELALEKYKKKLIHHKNRLLEWEDRMVEYNKLLPEWEEVESTYKVQILQRQLEEAEEALRKRLKRNPPLPEETTVEHIKQKLAKAKNKK
jgi:hypothetical protein